MPKLVCGEGHVGEVLDRFHLHECVEQIFARTYGTVVFKENGVVLCDVRAQTGRYFVCSGRGVWSKRDAPHGHHRLLAEHLIESSARTGEGRCDGWMGVDDRPYVWPPLVDGQVHADFTGHFPGPTKEATLEIDDDHVGSPDQSLTDSSRGDKKPVLIQTYREVS